MITCQNCKCEFDDLKEPEVAMGAVKCPNCKTIVDQTGKVLKKSFFNKLLKRKS